MVFLEFKDEFIFSARSTVPFFTPHNRSDISRINCGKTVEKRLNQMLRFS